MYLNSLKHCTMFWTKQRHTTFPYWGSPPEHQINRKHFRLYYTGASDWWRCCLKQKWAIHRGEVMLLCRCWIWLNSTHAYTFLWGIVVFETSCSCNSLKCPLGSQRANKDTKKYIFLLFYVKVNMLTATACFYFNINPEWSIFFFPLLLLSKLMLVIQKNKNPRCESKLVLPLALITAFRVGILMWGLVFRVLGPGCSSVL